MNEITLRRFNDMHCHFRSGKLLEQVLPFTAKYCGRAVAMPNTRPLAVLTGENVFWYQSSIRRVIKKMGSPDFVPVMTVEIRDSTTPKILENAFRKGVVAGKVYPLGVTTHSDKGLRNFFSKEISETFLAMQDLGILLLIHGELDLPRTLFTEREEKFLPTFLRLVEKFPKLKIVLEHISTKKSVELIEQLGPNVASTITGHHPLLTLNDSRLNPHNICNPTPKHFDDRDALVKAMTSGNPKFFLGSDTAPHTREKKECSDIACGVFSAPVLPSILTEIFEMAGALDKLNNFASGFGASFYNLPLNKGEITLIKKEWVVPDQYGSIVPFMAGQKLQWQLI